MSSRSLKVAPLSLLACSSTSGFWTAEKPSKLRAIKKQARAPLRRPLGALKASLRAKVERPFRVIKRQFGYTKVRYRSLAKNTVQVLTLFALSKLWMVRRQLLPGAGLLRL